MIREELVATGRIGAVEEAEARFVRVLAVLCCAGFTNLAPRSLEQLRAEVAALESKRAGIVRGFFLSRQRHPQNHLQTAAQLAYIDAQERSAKEAELRSKQMAAETEAQAAAMVEQQKKKMLAKQKAFVSRSLPSMVRWLTCLRCCRKSLISISQNIVGLSRSPLA